MTDELPDLTDLTVDEQKDELENLNKSELEDLRERESRQTAINNIDRELSNRHDQASEKEQETNDSSVEADQEDALGEEDMPRPSGHSSRLEELESKVDYLIENCKTTSKEGFEEYDN